MDSDRGGACPHELLPGVETVSVPSEGRSEEGKAAGDRGDRQEKFHCQGFNLVEKAASMNA
jgi:hypothetical protein